MKTPAWSRKRLGSVNTLSFIYVVFVDVTEDTMPFLCIVPGYYLGGGRIMEGDLSLLLKFCTNDLLYFLTLLHAGGREVQEGDNFTCCCCTSPEM